MGSHVWVEQCPYCSFEEMIVSTFNDYFEVTCQICGYVKSTEEKVPDEHDVQLAKRALREMDAKEKQKAVELYYADSIPLIARLKGESPNSGHA